MIYREIEINPNLKPFIMKYWTFALEGKTKVDADGYRDHHFLPDGCLNLVIFKDHGHNVMRLSGPQLVNYTVRVHKHIYYMGIRFHPATVESLFDVKVSDLIGKNIDPTPLMPPEVVDMLYAGYDRNSSAEFDLALRKFVNVKIDANTKILVKVIDRIIQLHGNINTEQIEKLIPFSYRQLQRLFSDELGYTVKQFSRMQRMRYALIQILQDGNQKIDAILESGFNDQSHFIKEFHLFTQDQYQMIEDYLREIKHMNVS